MSCSTSPQSQHHSNHNYNESCAHSTHSQLEVLIQVIKMVVFMLVVSCCGLHGLFPLSRAHSEPDIHAQQHAGVTRRGCTTARLRAIVCTRTRGSALKSEAVGSCGSPPRHCLHTHKGSWALRQSASEQGKSKTYQLSRHPSLRLATVADFPYFTLEGQTMLFYDSAAELQPSMLLSKRNTPYCACLCAGRARSVTLLN